MEGTKEIQELLNGVEALAVAIIDVTADGVGVGDVIKLAGDTALRAKVQAAIEGSSKISAEAKDLTIDEIGALAPEVTKVVVNIIKAIQAKGKEA